MSANAEFYIQQGLKYINKDLTKKWNSFVSQWMSNNGEIGLRNMITMLEQLSSEASFNDIYNVCETMGLADGLFETLLLFCKHFHPRTDKFMIYWYTRGNKYNQYNIVLDEELKGIAINNISIDTMYSINHGVRFDDIISIYKVNPNWDREMLEKAVNCVATFSAKGKNFKKYFYDHYNELDEIKSEVKVKK